MRLSYDAWVGTIFGPARVGFVEPLSIFASHPSLCRDPRHVPQHLVVSMLNLTPQRGRSNAKDQRTDLIEKVDMQNDRFFAYYKAQNIVPEEEWPTFVETLRQHLPTTFRVAGSRQYDSFISFALTFHKISLFRIANTLNSMIKDLHVPSLSNVVFEGQKIPPPVQIPWYSILLVLRDVLV